MHVTRLDPFLPVLLSVSGVLEVQVLHLLFCRRAKKVKKEV